MARRGMCEALYSAACGVTSERGGRSVCVCAQGGGGGGGGGPSGRTDNVVEVVQVNVCKHAQEPAKDIFADRPELSRERRGCQQGVPSANPACGLLVWSEGGPGVQCTPRACSQPRTDVWRENGLVVDLGLGPRHQQVDVLGCRHARGIAVLGVVFVLPKVLVPTPPLSPSTCRWPEAVERRAASTGARVRLRTRTWARPSSWDTTSVCKSRSRCRRSG